MRSPDLNAYAERWVRRLRQECLDRIIILNEAHLRWALREYVHYRSQRRPRTRPKHLVADKGYDSHSFRRYLRGRGIAHTIPPIRRRGRRRPGRPVQTNPIRYASRWIIERTNAWLQNYRRVLVRHERLLTTYPAFVVLACLLITLGALSR